MVNTPGCVIYNGTFMETSCFSCSSAYFLYSIGKAFSWNLNSSTICGKLMPNCINYTGLACSSCSPGFSVSGTSCVKSIVNCITYINIACSVCVSGFSSSGLSCVPTIPHCLVYNGTSCYTCNSGYITTNTSCVPNICFSTYGD